MHAMKIAFWYFKEFYRAIRGIYEKERLHNRVAFGMESKLVSKIANKEIPQNLLA